MEYDNTNRGVLFSNRPNKRDGKKDPDYKGRIDVNGTDCWLSAWLETSKDGTKYMSLRATPKEAKPAETPAPPPPDEPNDDIPF